MPTCHQIFAISRLGREPDLRLRVGVGVGMGVGMGAGAGAATGLKAGGRP